MNQTLRCDWPPERARWSYLSRSGLPAVSRKPEKFPQKPYYKSFIDQACSVKMAGYWPRSCEFMNLDFVSVHKHAKKELGHYPAILTSHLVNNPYFSVASYCMCIGIPKETKFLASLHNLGTQSQFLSAMINF